MLLHSKDMGSSPTSSSLRSTDDTDHFADVSFSSNCSDHGSSAAQSPAPAFTEYAQHSKLRCTSSPRLSPSRSSPPTRRNEHKVVVSANSKLNPHGKKCTAASFAGSKRQLDISYAWKQTKPYQPSTSMEDKLSLMSLDQNARPVSCAHFPHPFSEVM